MAGKFLELVLTPSVLAAQQKHFGRAQHLPPQPERDALTADEAQFVQSRDSFYMATLSETGWPYVQHRGGQPGFLRVVSSTQLAFADYKCNRQMLTSGNLAANDRVALFLMDYPRRERLKILGYARVEDARQHPKLVAQFAEPEARGLVERIFFVEVLSFDWNCQNTFRRDTPSRKSRKLSNRCGGASRNWKLKSRCPCLQHHAPQCREKLVRQLRRIGMELGITRREKSLRR
jgi:hypothetical protein